MTNHNRKKPTVLFLEPRSPDSHIFSIYPLPRLGSIILGTILRESGFDVKVLIEEIEPIDSSQLLEADVVGITTTTSTAPRAYAYADLARSMGKPVVLGGPHVTYRPKEALEHADCVVLGEGEIVAPVLFQRLAAGEPVSDLKGVATAANISNGSPVPAERLKDLDMLPIPDLSLVHGFDLKKRILRRTVVPVQASRGCPHDCSFCSVTGMFGRRFRFRSVDHVIEELDRYNRPGMSIFFYDDNLAANRPWFGELLERMATKNYSFNWSAQVRIEVAGDRELLRLIRRTKCTTLYIGVESLNPETLKAMNKHQTPGEIREAMVHFREHRLSIHGMFIFGMDTDTPESIRKTVSWAVRAGFGSVQFLILTPFPGTRTFQELSSQGRFLFDDWSLYDGHHVTFQPAGMSPAELQSLQLEAHNRFYSRFRTVKRIMTLRAESAGIFLYARNLQRRWRKANRIYRDLLKLMERSHGMIKRAQIDHPAGRLAAGTEGSAS